MQELEGICLRAIELRKAEVEKGIYQYIQDIDHFRERRYIIPSEFQYFYNLVKYVKVMTNPKV